MLSTINPANLVLSSEQWTGLMPYIILLAGSIVALLLGTISFPFSKNSKAPVFLFSCSVLLAVIYWTVSHWMKIPTQVFNGVMTIDYFSSFFNVLLASASLLVMFGSYRYLDKDQIHYSEFYPIILIATLGMMLLAATVELLSIFVSLELMSLAVYVLVGMRRRDRLSNEASVKYFVMGGVAAALYLYGVAFIYGALNTTKIADIAVELTTNGTMLLSNPILLVGLVLVLVGFLFKIAAAPFHMWAPDVYEGAPALITGYMATALKAAVFASFIRISVAFFGDRGVYHLGSMQAMMHEILWWAALGTMVIGNTVALMQNNIKRMLAYSAIAHTGYLLLGILAGPSVGYSSIMLYLVMYVVMNLGAFGLLGIFSGSNDSALTYDKVAGMAHKHPYSAAAFSIFLLSLAGLPPTAGFIGKYFLFSAALEAGEVFLVLLAVITSVISVFYYFKLVVQMYMKETTSETQYHKQASKIAYFAVVICVFLTINFGLFPGQIVEAVKKAAAF